MSDRGYKAAEPWANTPSARPHKPAADQVDVLGRATTAGTVAHGTQYRQEYVDTDWMDEAACAKTGTRDYFVHNEENEEGDTRKMEAQLAGIARCWGECSVREECLDYALKAKVRFGVWGGMTSEQRKKEAKRRKRES